MQNRLEIQKKYGKFKDYVDEAGPFFRQKGHYSLDEKIAFIADFNRSFNALIKFFEEDEELKEGKNIFLSANSTSHSKVSLTKKMLEQEFESAVSVIYFNLTTDEIKQMEESTKKSGRLQESLILRRLFDKYLG